MQELITPSFDTQKWNWSTIIGFSVFHIFAIVALFYFSWANLAAAGVLWWVSGSIGIGVGYHRLLTHRGFKVPKWLEYTLSVCGTLAMQSGPLTWVTTHRLHHAFTETEKDPHSPRSGTYWAHIGWMIRGQAQNQSWATVQRYCPDFANDKFHQVLNKYYYVPTIIVAAGLFAIGGFSMILWAIFLRVVIGWHFTWLVNSATHLWGTRRFETRDDSRNNALIAAITFGEGWHNNHHAYPRSARHGLEWYQYDPNWLAIWTLEKLGLVSDVYVYKSEPGAVATGLRAVNQRREETKDTTQLEPIHETA